MIGRKTATDTDAIEPYRFHDDAATDPLPGGAARHGTLMVGSNARHTFAMRTNRMARRQRRPARA